MSFLSISIFTGLFRAKSAHTADRLENGRLEKENELFKYLNFAGLFRANSAPTADRLKNGRLEKGNELFKYLNFRQII